MFFESTKAIKRENAKLRKDNVEMVNRIKEMRNQIAILQTNFTSEVTQMESMVKHIQSTLATSLTQVDRCLRSTVDKVVRDDAAFAVHQYINETEYYT